MPVTSNPRRVVITGMGAITSLGSTVESIWQGIVDGRSGVTQIQQFDSRDFPVRIGSEIDVNQLPPLPADAPPSQQTRAGRFGLWALEQAWNDAGLYDHDFDPWRAGVCVGCSNFPVMEDRVIDLRELFDGDQFKMNKYYALCRKKPELLTQRDMGAISTLISSCYPLQGISTSVQAACASGTQAVGEAFQMIRYGQADLMVTGGTDSLLSAISVTGFTLLGALSVESKDPAKASRPFDKKRTGFVLGEGAGLLILEELTHAQQRGAPIYAELIGYGSSVDGYRFTDMHPEGLGAVRCMNAALQDAGVAPHDVGYINAHGTSTPLNDKTETMAIKKVFGDYAYQVPVSSTKSQIGHLICAAGGIELIFTVLAVNHGVLPPTINLEHPDPECDLDFIPNECRTADVDVALSNSFGFGGQNGTLVIKRWGADQPY
ncbi:MAG: beta-ketoacyl-[acyl-carrier-protein] synthase family protein [Gammaproteobacteria bacterium]|jgi:3-oxoacyl-[acyl-carrier-protein] synthase II